MTNAKPITGEQLEARRRRFFWGMMTVFGLIGMSLGFFTGFSPGTAGDDIAPGAAIAISVGGAAFVIGSSLFFFSKVDELELADNLWSCFIGLYFYFMLVPGWWVLERGGLVPPIDSWTVYLLTAIVASLTYLARKIINR